MDAIGDFEDLLALLGKHRARYLIVGGLAYIYHVKPRYTKDMDLWVDATPTNLDRVNRALTEFGSPLLLAPEDADRILQIGVAPNRVDVLMTIPGVRFGTAWGKRVRDRYGSATANWISLDDLLRAKRGIDNPRHQEDVRMLRKVKESRRRKRS
jgi:hypothetical protein